MNNASTGPVSRLTSSIQSRLIGLFVISMVLILFSVVMSSRVQQRRFDGLRHLNSLTSQVNSIAVDAAAIGAEIHQLLRDPTADRIGRIDRLARHALHGLNRVEPARADSWEVALHIRVLRNMLDEIYAGQTAVTLRRTLRGSLRFDQVQYLRLLSFHLAQVAQQLSGVWLQGVSQEQRELYESVARAGRQALVVAIVAIALGAIGSFAAIRKTYRPIKEIGTFASALSRHDWDAARLTPMRDPQLRAVVEALESMKSEIVAHLERERKRRKRVERRMLHQQASLAALQAQLNPHFLFNALNTVKRSLEHVPIAKSQEMIDSIAGILRYSLNHTTPLVGLSDELRVTRDYMFVQSMRFGKRLCFQEMVDACVTRRIPPFAMQVLVENAVEHGLKDVLDRGIIAVSVGERGERLEIFVRDNGPGLDIATLERIEERMTSDQCLPGDRIGLNNLYHRLRELYGADFSLTLQSVPGEGTTAALSIPTGDVQ